MRYKAIAVRPYPNPLRGRVFQLLSRLGIEVEVPPQLEGSATNDEVVSGLRGRRPDLLVVPYHALRDREDARTSGLDLVARLREQVPELRDVLVVMPVSIYGQFAFDAVWRRQPPERVFPILEEDFDEDAVVENLGETLRAHHSAR